MALLTPLIPLAGDPSYSPILLKLENMQPITSYKIRGAGNALKVLIESGRTPSCVVTASAGNFAQGLLYVGVKLKVATVVIVPDHAPETKLNAMKRIDPKVRVVKVPFAIWWEVLLSDGRHQANPEANNPSATFISPVTNTDVMAGNGTCGLEIIRQCVDDRIDCVIIPYGGGALAVGIASAIKQLRPSVKCFAVETDTAAPLAASFKAGKPVEFDYQPSFVDGMGGRSVFPSMWERVKTALDGSLVVSVNEVAEAVKFLANRNCLVTEGAGAAAVAAAMRYQSVNGWKNKVVCIVSGGNIDAKKLSNILLDLPV